MKVIIKKGHDMPAGVKELFTEYGKMLSKSLDMMKFTDEVKKLPGEYAPPEGALLYAECDDVPAGVAAVRRFSDEICELKRMYVNPKCRGEGAGAALVRAAIKESRELGYKTMYVDNVGGLTAALRMYDKLGFKRIELYYEGADADVVYFALDLSETE